MGVSCNSFIGNWTTREYARDGQITSPIVIELRIKNYSVLD